MHEDNKKVLYSRPATDSSDDEYWSETYGSSDDEDWNASGGSRTPGKRKNYTPKYKTNRKSNGSAHLFENLGYQEPHPNGNKSLAFLSGNVDETVKQRLHEIYLENQYPTREEKESIAQKLGIDYHLVHNWFNNTRHTLSVGPSNSPVPDNSNNLAITVIPTVNSLPKKRGRPRKTVPVTQANEGSTVSKIDSGAYQTTLPMPNISHNSANIKLTAVNNRSSLPMPNMNDSSVNTEPTTVTSLPRKRGRPRKIVAEAQVEKGSIINQTDSGAYQTTLPMPNISNTSANTEFTSVNNPPNQVYLSAYQSSLPMPNINSSSVNTEPITVTSLPRKTVTEVQVEKESIINQIDSSAYQTTLPLPNISNTSAITELTTVNIPLNQSNLSAYQSSLPVPNVSDRVVNTKSNTVSVQKKRGRPRKIVTEAHSQMEKGSAMTKMASSAYQTTLSMPNTSNNSFNTESTTVVSVQKKRGRPRKIVSEVQVEKGSIIRQIDSGAYHDQTTLPLPNISNSSVPTKPTVICVPKKRGRPRKIVPEIQAQKGSIINQIDSGAYQTSLLVPYINNNSINAEPTTVNIPPNESNLNTYQSSLPVPNINNSFINTVTTSMKYAANKSGKKGKMAIEIPLKEGHSIDQIDRERRKAIARELMRMKSGR